MKKIIASLLTLAMILSSGVFVMAQGIEAEAEQATFGIGIEAEEHPMFETTLWWIIPIIVGGVVVGGIVVYCILDLIGFGPDVIIGIGGGPGGGGDFDPSDPHARP